MIKTIYFVTSNIGKFKTVSEFISSQTSKIKLENIALDIPEYQSLDIEEIAKGKAIHAWDLVKKPLLVDDGGIFLEKYNQFPGALTKYVYQGIGLEGFWKLAKEDPRAYFLTCMVYIDGPCSYRIFTGKCNGTIADPKTQIISDKHLPLADIFIPEGYNLSLNELRRQRLVDNFHREFALQSLLDWITK